MKYTCLLPVCFILLFLANSCETDMQLEISTNEKRLLVDGSFTTDSIIHTIELYRSGSLTTGRPQMAVSGATISITDNIETFYYKESDSVPGLYLTEKKCRGKGGHTYHLSITNVDIDEDGETDSYTATGLMPEPVVFDSLATEYMINGDGVLGVYYFSKCMIRYNSPAYIFSYIIINDQLSNFGTIGECLGTRFFNEHFLEQPVVDSPGQEISQTVGDFTTENVNPGDNLCLVSLNFTQQQSNFIKEFNDNTSGDSFEDMVYDQLRMPSNLSTNIEPADKAAGYFFIYSVSRISGKFEE